MTGFKSILFIAILVAGSVMFMLGIQHWVPETITPLASVGIGLTMVVSALYLNNQD